MLPPLAVPVASAEMRLLLLRVILSSISSLIFPPVPAAVSAVNVPWLRSRELAVIVKLPAAPEAEALTFISPPSLTLKLSVVLTFPVKCFGQAPSPHKDRVILTNHARELGCQWESDDDVRDSPPDKPQLRLPSQRLE